MRNRIRIAPHGPYGWTASVAAAVLFFGFASIAFADDLTTNTITRFSFTASNATIGENAIAVIVPYGTDVTNLIPTIEHTGSSVLPASGVAQNFSSPVTYVVTAADNSGRTYTVTVSVMTELATAKIDAHVALAIAFSGYEQKKAEYSDENWTVLAAFRTDGDTAIEVATDIPGVTSAKTTALSGMSGVLTLAQVDALATATTAVATAEEAKTQATVDTAQALVTALVESTAKTALQERLDAVQAQVDESASAAVEALIGALPASDILTLSHTDQVSAARNAYDALTDAQENLVANYAVLQAVEARIVALEMATAAVEVAEESAIQADVDAAQTHVTALASGTAKTTLQSRIDLVQVQIDIAAAFSVSMSIAALPSVNSLSLADDARVSAARNAYNALTASQKARVSNYDVLLSVEAKMAALATATAAVATAEGAKTQVTVDTAQALVTALIESAAKTALQARLDAVQAQVTAAVGLSAAQTDAHAAVESEFLKYRESDYFSDDWDDLVTFREDGDDDIDAATDVAGVASAKKTAIDGMDDVKTIEQTDPDAVNDLEAEYRPETKSVRITWSVDDERTEEVRLYRGTTGTFSVGSDSLIATQDANDDSYTDDKIDFGLTYYYKAVARNEAGSVSDTERVSVVIPALGSDTEQASPAEVPKAVPATAESPIETVARAATAMSPQVGTADRTGGISRPVTVQEAGSVLGADTADAKEDGSGFFGSLWMWLMLALGGIFLVSWQLYRFGRAE